MRTIKNLVGSILISLAVLLVWVLVLPDYDNRDYLETLVLTRTADLEAKSRLIDKTLELDKEYQSKYAELKRLALVVPSEKHIEETITILENIFSSTGVPLRDMALSSNEGEIGSAYDLVDIELNFNTSYDSVINFLIAVEKSLRLIDTTRFTVGINKEEVSESGPRSLSASFKARAYFVPETISKNTVEKTQRETVE